MKKFKNLMTALVLALGLAAPMAFAGLASAQTSDLQGSLCSGAELSVGTKDCSAAEADTATSSINGLVKTGLDIFSWVVGVISVVMIMVGGVKYITSQGSSEGVTAAKNTILYAAVGLVVVALAQVIVRFVLNQAINSGDTTMLLNTVLSSLS